MNDISEEEIARGFERLRETMEKLPDPPCELSRSERSEEAAESGDIWVAGEEIAPDEEAVGNLWVMLLERTPADCKGTAVWRVVPVFSEIEFATDEDAVLPRRAMGGRAGLAFGCEAPVAASSFRRIVGQLSDEWRDKALQFRRRLEDDSLPWPEGIETGVPATHPHDPAVAFHENLVKKLEPLMAPVLREAMAGEPVKEISAWLRDRWRETVEAAGRSLADWIDEVVLPLPQPAPVPAGFHADDGSRLSENPADSALEFRLSGTPTTFLLMRERSSWPNWRIQVLEDPEGRLEGAEIWDPAGQSLATIENEVSGEFPAPDEGVVLRLPDGTIPPIERIPPAG